MARIIVTPRARRDVDGAIAALSLPADTWPRIAKSLRTVGDFPLAGRELSGRWRETRFVLGPWSWMLLLYSYDGDADTVYIVAMHDARSSTATARRKA